MVRLTDRPDLTLDVYRGQKTTIQQQQQQMTYRCRTWLLQNYEVYVRSVDSYYVMLILQKRLILHDDHYTLNRNTQMTTRKKFVCITVVSCSIQVCPPCNGYY